MKSPRIALDWKALLGFDQVDDLAASARTAKVGRKQMGPALGAKVGEKGPPPGVIGRPQQLAIIKG